MPPLSPEHRAKISAAMKGRKQSPEHLAALSAVRRGKVSPAQLEALERARASYTEDSRRKHSATMSAKMKGAPRTKAQQEAFNTARAKAHAKILRGDYPEGPLKYGLFALVGEQLRERDGDLCQLCLTRIDFDVPHREPMSRSVDHINPRNNGGSDELFNLWLAHLVCNQRKGSRYVGRADGTRDPRRHSWSEVFRQHSSKEGSL